MILSPWCCMLPWQCIHFNHKGQLKRPSIVTKLIGTEIHFFKVTVGIHLWNAWRARRKMPLVPRLGVHRVPTAGNPQSEGCPLRDKTESDILKSLEGRRKKWVKEKIRFFNASTVHLGFSSMFPAYKLSGIAHWSMILLAWPHMSHQPEILENPLVPPTLAGFK